MIERIKASSHVWLDGLMGYEAQIAGVGDNFPGQRVKNALVQGLKKRSIREVAKRRATLADLVRTYELSPRFVNGGGTGSIATTRRESVVTEITVGSGFYAPRCTWRHRRRRHDLPWRLPVFHIRGVYSRDPIRRRLDEVRQQ